MYTVAQYRNMLADSIRTGAYTGALRRLVQPDCVVVDIGTGIGMFALLAARLGARRVYAIECDDMIEAARQIAALNHCSASIEFIQGHSTEVTLPERADVIVSDLRGVLPLFQRHLPSIIDARRRFLAPSGALIPRQDTLWAAVADAPDLCPAFPDCGFQVEPATRLLLNSWRKARVKPEQLLTDPWCCAVLDYSLIDTPDLHSEIRWVVERPGTAHGFVVWFDSIIAEGISFSNAPSSPELVYGAGFFPFAEPVSVSPGEVVETTLRANLVGDDYVWRWDTRVLDGVVAKLTCNQSTFHGTPLAPARLHRMAPRFAPEIGREGEVDRFVMGLMDGRNSLTEIARLLSAGFPGRFASESDCLARAREVSERYSR